MTLYNCASGQRGPPYTVRFCAVLTGSIVCLSFCGMLHSLPGSLPVFDFWNQRLVVILLLVLLVLQYHRPASLALAAFLQSLINHSSSIFFLTIFYPPYDRKRRVALPSDQFILRDHLFCTNITLIAIRLAIRYHNFVTCLQSLLDYPVNIGLASTQPLSRGSSSE